MDFAVTSSNFGSPYCLKIYVKVVCSLYLFSCWFDQNNFNLISERECYHKKKIKLRAIFNVQEIPLFFKDYLYLKAGTVFSRMMAVSFLNSFMIKFHDVFYFLFDSLYASKKFYPKFNHLMVLN